MTDTIEKAYKRALEARERAYCPYSNFKVGASIKVADSDKIFVGCNVENAGYGSTICAERNAIISSIAALGRVSYDFLILVTDTNPAASPCGQCLQVMAEFCPPDFTIYFANLDGIDKQFTLNDLLPQAFTRDSSLDP